MSDEIKIERIERLSRHFVRGPESQKFIDRLYTEACTASQDGKAVRFRAEDQREAESIRNAVQRRARADNRRAYTESGNNGYVSIWIDLHPTPWTRHRKG